MKLRKTVFSLLVILAMTLSATVVTAGDFDWMRDLNVRAEADRDGFRARLAARFRVGDAQVQLVLGNVDRPADAYMLFRLGEMAARPVNDVLQRYRTDRSGGWGALAKSLGIKPGSAQFHALKEGGDLYGEKGNGRGNGKGKSKGKGRG